MTRVTRLIGLVLPGLVLPLVLPAQELSGALIGVVSDPSSSGVANAEVEVLNVQTHVKRSVATGSEGTYEAAGLLPGTYQLTAKAPGFSPTTVDNITLAFGARQRIDVQLKIGALTDTVTVSVDSALIETDTSRVNEVLSTKAVLDLPYNQLSTLNLARFVPGTYPASGNFEWSSAGMGNTQIAQSFDGVVVNNMNGGLNGSYYFSPSIDAVQEVSYTLLNQSAENGFASTYSVITKSGSNQFHGSAWLFLSNNAWNARNFFAVSAPPDGLDRRYGGTLGGPIAKNRTFFFADLQWEKADILHQYNDLVPTDKLRGGDFSGLAPILNPLTRTPFPNNLIPSSRISPTSLAVLKFYYQEPTIARDANFGFFNKTVTQSTNLQSYDFRFDHRINDKQSLMGRFERQLYGDYNGLVAPNPAWGSIKRIDPAWLVTISHTYAITPRILNEARFGWDQSPDRSEGDLKGADVVGQLGLTGYGVSLPNFATVPGFNISGIASFGSPRVPVRTDTVTDIADTLTVVRNRHTLKGGLLFRPMSLYQQLPEAQGLFGSATFTGNYTGIGMGDFLLGMPQTSTSLSRSDYLNRRIIQYDWFVQDDIRVSQRLTLNVGLRFERNPSPRETNENLLWVFNPATGTIVVPIQRQLDLVSPAVRAAIPFTLASQTGLPSDTLIEQRNRLWYPRIGLAFRPFHDSRTVLRAGYGMYAIDNANLFSPVGSGPYGVTQTFTNAITSSGPAYMLPQMFPAGSGNAIAPGAFSIGTQQLRRPVPYSQQWNFSVERQIFSDMSLRLSYQGNRTTHLPYAYNLNQPLASTTAFAQSRRPYPIYGNITYNEFRANEIYHGLVVVLSKRLSKGLMFDASYLWTHNLGDAFTYNGGNSLDRYSFRADRGNDPYTPRQRFTSHAVWEVPFGKGRRYGANVPLPLEVLAGGWQVSGVFAAQTGTFFTPTFSGVDTANINTFGGRAQVTGDWRVSSPTLERWFNPAAFAVPANGRFGNAGPYSIQGPGWWDLDAGIYKQFPLFHERHVIRVEGTFINVMNHPIFANPVANISSPVVGAITATNSIEGGGGRTIQIGFRYRF